MLRTSPSHKACRTMSDLQDKLKKSIIEFLKYVLSYRIIAYLNPTPSIQEKKKDLPKSSVNKFSRNRKTSVFESGYKNEVYPF